MDNNLNKKIKSSNLIDNFNLKWSIKILISSFFLSVIFSFISEKILTNASFIISIMIILILMFLGVIADMCGVAITSCSLDKFLELEKNNVKYSKTGIMLIKNSDKISVICCDIIGDICSILSGACGASIVYKLVTAGVFLSFSTYISICVSGLIACLTIFFKSLEKSIAVTKNIEITLFISKCINNFIN